MRHRKPILWTSGVLLTLGIIGLGFGHTYGKILSCKVVSEAWVTAEYSEYSTYLSADGTMNSSTDYWSEPASDRYKVVTVNGELSEIYGSFDPLPTGNSYYKPPMPRWDTSMSRDFDFDNFEQRRSDTLTVNTYLAIEGEYSSFSTRVYNNPNCISKLDGYVTVKTWYGITYGSDFE